MMKMLKSFLYLWVIFAVLIMGCNSNSTKMSDPVKQESNLKDAKDLVLFKVNKESIKLSEWKGRTVLVNIWASWCPPCVEEMPSLIEFAKIAKKELNLDIIAVSMDDEWQDVENLFKKMKLGNIKDSPLIIVRDENVMVTKEYGVNKFPETFLINKDFKVQRKFIGSQNWTSPQMLKWMSNYAR